MSAEATRVGVAPIAVPRVATHVLVCGAAAPAIDIALFLRRLDEAVTLLAFDVRAEARRTLERAGVRVVIGSPRDPHALTDARAAEARAAIITEPSDLAGIEALLAIRTSHAELPVVCCVQDPDLAARAERSLGARIAVCPSTVEAIHLAGCSFGSDVVGAFSLDDDLVLLRRGSLAPNERRILVAEEADGRQLVAPPAGWTIPANATVTTIERVTSSRSPQLFSALARASRNIRGNTPRALAWTTAVLAALAAASTFVFMAGMNISFSEAAYLVMNTISTVGYGDITPFESGRFMRIYGSFVALLGPALLGTLLLIFARAVLRPQAAVPPARDHVIIAAPPRIATAASAQLARVSIESVIVSTDAPLEPLARATNVDQARAFIAATSDPVKNVALGLAAREANPSIHIVLDAPDRIAKDIAMTTPVNAIAACIATSASAAIVGGLHYAITIGDRVFSFFEGRAGNDWGGQRPSDIAGAYNFIALFRKSEGGPWREANDDAAFDPSERVLVAAWRLTRDR